MTTRATTMAVENFDAIGDNRSAMKRCALVAIALALAVSFVAPARADEPSPSATTAPATTATATTTFVAAPDEHQSFLGWHPSGEVHYVTLLDAANKLTGVRVCREQGDDVPSAWPAKITVGSGVLCANVVDADVGGPVAVFAMGEVGAANKPLKASPWGLKIELSTTTDGPTTTHALSIVDPGSKDRALALSKVTAPEVLKLGEVLWRKDGAAVAIALESAKPVKGALARRLIVVADASSLLVGGGAAAHKVAVAKEKDAAALMKKRDWSGAGRVLDEALAADPNYAAAHYARAAAEAQGGIGRTAMIENLTWLKQASATDAAAKKLLDGAKKDSAFDAWCGEPEVRELVGLPAVSSMDVPARLTERTATWTLQGASCRNPWATLVFLPGHAGKDGKVTGQGTLEVAESCKGQKTKQKQPLSWTQTAEGPFVVTTKALETGSLKLPARSTIVLDDTQQQLKLVPDDGGDAVGTFEPGRALIDDSVL
jgi:hypothetical protein